MTVRVTLELPSVLADVAGGRRSLAVEMDGAQPTVADLLDLVAGVHPHLVRRLRTESGPSVRPTMSPSDRMRYGSPLRR